MTIAATAIASGLTQRTIEWYLRNHTPLDEIAQAHRTDVVTVQLLISRWGVRHLSGREKSNVTLIRGAK